MQTYRCVCASFAVVHQPCPIYRSLRRCYWVIVSDSQFMVCRVPRLMRSALSCQHFLKAVDESGNIYTKRWGDAPIQTVALSLFASSKAVSRIPTKVRLPAPPSPPALPSCALPCDAILVPGAVLIDGRPLLLCVARAVAISCCARVVASCRGARSSEIGSICTSLL